MTRSTGALPAVSLGWLLALVPPTGACAESPAISRALDALNSVHSISEVALSPDGKHLVYGRRVRGRRGGAEVDSEALYLIDAKDGSAERRLSACP